MRRVLVIAILAAGGALGCFSLGIAYANGEGVTQDKAKAAQLYQKVCDAGVAAGCYNLGVMYEHSEGVAQDKTKAAQLFQKACDNGDARSCRCLALVGRGVSGP